MTPQQVAAALAVLVGAARSYDRSERFVAAFDNANARTICCWLATMGEANVACIATLGLTPPGLMATARYN